MVRFLVSFDDSTLMRDVDFFQALMEDRNGDPNNLEWGEIVAEVSIMLNAGSDTTVSMRVVLKLQGRRLTSTPPGHRHEQCHVLVTQES